jgi:hypothetical protein
LPQMPEKSGSDSVPWLRSCVNADEANRAAAEVVAMRNVRITEFSRYSKSRVASRRTTSLSARSGLNVTPISLRQEATRNARLSRQLLSTMFATRTSAYGPTRKVMRRGESPVFEMQRTRCWDWHDPACHDWSNLKKRTGVLPVAVHDGISGHVGERLHRQRRVKAPD